jgi:rhamnulokinase
MGVEIESPIFSDEALQNNFTNEGAVDGRILFLRNITGFWILQQVMHEWRKMDITVDYASLIEEAETLSRQAIIDVDASDFRNPSSMIEAIVAYCKKTQQTFPETTGEFMRCIVDSLAHKYNSVAKSIEACTKQKIEQIHIVGGGCQNNLLNQLIADSLGVEVVAGPVEATALGNILVQAIAKGDISSLHEGRQIIHQTVELKIFKPKSS